MQTNVELVRTCEMFGCLWGYSWSCVVNRVLDNENNLLPVMPLYGYYGIYSNSKQVEKMLKNFELGSVNISKYLNLLLENFY